ncbi:hypothetical protein FF1_017877 [Malus domestica]
MAHEKQLKWEGEASAELKGPKAEQVWPLLEDFFGLHKWFPTLTTCLLALVSKARRGCVRFCTGFKTPVDQRSDRNQDQEKVNWTKQKLLVVRKDAGCTIVWKYEVEPVEGWRLEDVDLFIGTGLQVMASRMEASLYNPEIKPGDKSGKVTSKLGDEDLGAEIWAQWPQKNPSSESG